MYTNDKVSSDKRALERLVESYGKKDVLMYVRRLNEEDVLDDEDDDEPYTEEEIEELGRREAALDSANAYAKLKNFVSLDLSPEANAMAENLMRRYSEWSCLSPEGSQEDVFSSTDSLCTKVFDWYSGLSLSDSKLYMRKAVIAMYDAISILDAVEEKGYPDFGECSRAQKNRFYTKFRMPFKKAVHDYGLDFSVNFGELHKGIRDVRPISSRKWNK